MRQFCLSVIAVLSLASAACAQGDVRTADAASSNAGPYPAVTSYGLQPFGRVVRNANDCAPSHPEAVWGAGGAPLGYACTDSANGQ